MFPYPYRRCVSLRGSRRVTGASGVASGGAAGATNAVPPGRVIGPPRSMGHPLGPSPDKHRSVVDSWRRHILAGGADERDLDRLTHPSPKSASEMYTRTGIIWPRLCRAVRAIQIPHLESVCTPRVHPAGLRVVANGGNPPERQGEEEVLNKRRDRGIEPPRSASQHPSPVLKTGPGTSLGRPAAVRCSRAGTPGQGRYRGAFDGRSAAAGAAWSSPYGVRRSAVTSCGMARRRTRKYCMGE